MNLKPYLEFSGNAAALAAAAVECARAIGLELDEDKTGERLVRYYAAEGVIDRPERIGRDAAYGYRHLLQVLTARRMAQVGTTLSVIAQHNAAATTRALEQGLQRPLPTAAEVLVSGFLSSASAKGSSIKSLVSAEPYLTLRPAKPQAASASPRPQLALADVLDEMRRITGEQTRRIRMLEQMQQAAHNDVSSSVGQAMQQARGEFAQLVGKAAERQERTGGELIVQMRKLMSQQEDLFHRLAAQLEAMRELQQGLRDELAQLRGKPAGKTPPTQTQPAQPPQPPHPTNEQEGDTP